MSGLKKLAFESVSCSRCGGGGRYSWCQRYRDICFKCHGRGETLTKRGAAAQAFYSAALSKPASVIQAGDKFLDSWPQNHWKAVSAVAVQSDGQIELKGDGWSWFANPDTVMRVARSKEFKQAKLAEALVFQASLTKAGKVRKGAKS